MSEVSQALLECLRGLLFPVAAAAVTALFAVFFIDRYKSGRVLATLLVNLRREMRLAKFIHPINQHSAEHVTGAFVPYPVETVTRLLFDPTLDEKLPVPLSEALQDYIHEALRINSLIENAKLLMSSGKHLGAEGMTAETTKALRKALGTASIIEGLIAKIQEAIPK